MSQSGVTYSYLGWITQPLIGVGEPSAGTSITLPALIGSGSLPINVSSWQAVTTYQPHGPWLYAGSDGGESRFWWVDCSAASSTITLAGTTSGTANFQLKSWNDGTVTRQAGTSLTSSVSTSAITITQSGYYSLEYNSSTATDTFQITISGVGPVWAHRAVNLSAPKLASINQVRMVGVSMRYANRAAELAKEGMIYPLQLPKGDNWMHYVGNAGGLTLASLKSEPRLAVNGCYGFLKPTGERDFEPTKDFEVNPAGVLVDSCYPLEPTSGILGFQIQIPDVTGRVGELIFKYSLDFETTDPWVNTAYAADAVQPFDDAVGLIKKIQQFHDNPLHFAQIIDGIRQGIKTGAGFINRIAPTVLRGTDWLENNL